MDQTDLKILELLCNDSRMAHSQIANKIGESSSKIKSQLKKLHDSNIIDKYCIQVDPNALGIEKMALLIISTEKMKSSGEEPTSEKSDQFLQNIIQTLLENVKEIMVAFHDNQKIYLFILVLDETHMKEVMKKINKNPFINNIKKIELKLDSYNNQRILDLTNYKDKILKKNHLK